MKKILLLIAIGLFSVTSTQVSAQNVTETSVKFKKGNANATVAYYEVPEEAIEQILKDKLAKENIGKIKSSKGMIAFSGVRWQRISEKNLDYYFIVDGKKNKSTISVVASYGNDNFISSSSDEQVINNIKNFLNDFDEGIRAYQLANDIRQQEQIVSQAEKEYNKSVDKSVNLDKEKVALEQKIVEAKNMQAQSQSLLQNEMQKLEELKSKLK